MSRFIAAAPPTPKGERSAMNTENHMQSSRNESRRQEYGEDPSALTENCDYPPPLKTVKTAPSASAVDKSTDAGDDDNDDDEVAVPIPIATLVFQDGRTEPVYQPLAGHEHLFKARPMISSLASFSNRASGIQRLAQPAPTQVLGEPQHPTPEPRQKAKSQRQPISCKQRKPAAYRQGLLKSKSLKRSRSVAQGLAPNRKAVVENDVDDSDENVRIVTEESHTFYIGNIDAFKEFLRCRFDELTMKPLRGIATHWVKLLEPRRLGDWGKYHEKLPTEAETPPWWPTTVIYKEPSHLKKSDLSTLAVEMMLVHREIDEIKRKGPWITKLRDVAKFTVQTTSADHFSSSKGAAHSEEMKKRALEQILPSIFDVAQAYEDHMMQYSLFEGSGNADPGRGKHHTWKPIPRPVRRQQPKRPRRGTERSPDNVQETTCEASGDETEPDETMTRLGRVPYGLSQAAPSHAPMTAPGPAEMQTGQECNMAEGSHVQTWKVDTPASISGPCTPAASQDDVKMHRTASTPNSSFDQSLHGLHLGEEELSLKPHGRTMSDSGNMHGPYNMGTYHQPLAYAAPATGFGGQGYPPTDHYANAGAPSFGQNGASFINPFSMYNTAPPAPISYRQYTSPMPTANEFPYEGGMFPANGMSMSSTGMSMAMTAADDNMAFHGLPCDYAVGGPGLHPF